MFLTLDFSLSFRWLVIAVGLVRAYLAKGSYHSLYYAIEKPLKFFQTGALLEVGVLFFPGGAKTTRVPCSGERQAAALVGKHVRHTCFFPWAFLEWFGDGREEHASLKRRVLSCSQRWGRRLPTLHLRQQGSMWSSVCGTQMLNLRSCDRTKCVSELLRLQCEWFDFFFFCSRFYTVHSVSLQIFSFITLQF